MVRTLANGFAANRIPQAWMLTGVRGVGKTTTARILARGLNYARAGEPDTGPTVAMPELGLHCAAIMESRHMDVLEMDAASHTGIDDVRAIIDGIRYGPVSARYKVYIVDEVHMLSEKAFNAFLKTLEEPPPHAKFVFATTEIRKVPVTILSRCQRFDLRRVEAPTLHAHLAKVCAAEGVTAEDEALGAIVRAAEGSVRDALSLLDQAIAHGAGTVTAQSVRDMLGLADRARILDLFEAVMRGSVPAAFAELRAQYDSGADPSVVLSDLAAFTHLVTRLKVVPEARSDPTLSETERVRGAAVRRDALGPRPVAGMADPAQGDPGGPGRAATACSGRDGDRAPRLRGRPADPRRGSASTEGRGGVRIGGRAGPGRPPAPAADPRPARRRLSRPGSRARYGPRGAGPHIRTGRDGRCNRAPGPSRHRRRPPGSADTRICLRWPMPTATSSCGRRSSGMCISCTSRKAGSSSGSPPVGVRAWPVISLPPSSAGPDGAGRSPSPRRKARRPSTPPPAPRPRPDARTPPPTRSCARS